MSQTEERIARNNAIFRDANEKIRARADEYGVLDGKLPFLCECPSPACVDLLHLSPDEYESVRQDSRHYIVAPGHETAEAPRAQVVERLDTYVVVSK